MCWECEEGAVRGPLQGALWRELVCHCRSWYTFQSPKEIITCAVTFSYPRFM